EGVFERVFGLQDVWQAEGSNTWWEKMLFAFFGVALVEELCKFLFLKGFIYDELQFSEPFDGLIYGGILGCGFATVENLMYVLPLGQETGMVRMITAVPGHAFEGMILGYFMGRAKFSHTPEKHLATGLVLVVVLHGIYDSAVFAHGWWSSPLVFGMVFLGIYFGLKAKKEMEKHSEVIEFSLKEYSLPKDRRKERPLLLKDIRNMLSKGKLRPDDLLVVKKTGKTKSIKEIFSSKIISQYAGLAKTPVPGQPIKYFLILYTLTFGFYFYFWFLKNYRDLRNYRRIDLNPEFKSLALFISAVIPYYILGWVLEKSGISIKNIGVKISMDLVVVGIMAVFLFFQLRLLKRFLRRKMKGTFNVAGVLAGFMVFNGLVKGLPPDQPYYWLIVIGLVLGEAGILAVVQKDLNAYWALAESPPAGAKR
nr:PrsW family intramembrane metalloprotease [Nitrospinaceae bacterium]NIR57567.1 PrsW family intramembrane metalloprotease [Nitrospinaceae bacterium]NIS88037.1 PrsW family intramembrane metalloprotease [Nitrospinaceae bacterium]NIT84901.1 PrsW family intramembrane metalloprotease [Nitrospinaceae bacterium]NIU47077.1 PrsW family intramembrane metalloprotease [Nitrospinaceae bacterium]